MLCIIPKSNIEKVSIYVNKNKKTMTQIKQELGCQYIINAGLFNMTTFKPINMLKVDGVSLSTGGNPFGYAINGNKVVFSYDNNVNYPTFISAYPVLVRNGKKTGDAAPAGLGGYRARSCIGVTAKGDIVLACDTANRSIDWMAEELKNAGCDTAINLDGGGSSQCNFDGKQLTSSRIVHNFICVWTKKNATTEGEEMKTYTNGNSRKTVYETTACTKQIGSLDPNETCSLLYEDSKFKVVMYYITGTTERKVGFIK